MTGHWDFSMNMVSLVCHSLRMMSYTDTPLEGAIQTHHCESTCRLSYIVVFSTRLQNILPTTVCLCLKFLFTSIYHLQGVSNYLFHILSTANFESRAFSVAGPTACNSLPDEYRALALQSVILYCALQINIYVLTYLLFYLLMLSCFFLLSDYSANSCIQKVVHEDYCNRFHYLVMGN